MPGVRRGPTVHVDDPDLAVVAPFVVLEQPLQGAWPRRVLVEQKPFRLAAAGDQNPIEARTRGHFMAALALHPSAEPGTIVVRAAIDLRDALLTEAPDAYYLTAYYAPHPVVLARIARLSTDALTDLLAASWRLSGPSSGLRHADSDA